MRDGIRESVSPRQGWATQWQEGDPPHPDKMEKGALVCVADVGDWSWRGEAMKGIQGAVREANIGIWDSQHGSAEREWL